MAWQANCVCPRRYCWQSIERALEDLATTRLPQDLLRRSPNEIEQVTQHSHAIACSDRSMQFTEYTSSFRLASLSSVLFGRIALSALGDKAAPSVYEPPPVSMYMTLAEICVRQRVEPSAWERKTPAFLCSLHLACDALISALQVRSISKVVPSEAAKQAAKDL